MNKTTKRLWTAEEILFLRENYHTLGYEVIAEKLGRPNHCIRGKASKLGISKKKAKPKYFWRKPSTKQQTSKRCPHCGKLL